MQMINMTFCHIETKLEEFFNSNLPRDNYMDIPWQEYWKRLTIAFFWFDFLKTNKTNFLA